MANEDKKLVSLAGLQRFSYNFRDALNQVLDTKQDIIVFNPELPSGATLNELDHLKVGNNYFYNPGTIYVFSTALESGDEIEDADLIAAYTRHQPLQINNLVLYYQTTSNGSIQYSNTSFNGINTVVSMYLFNTTTNILTIRLSNI